jgi:hypothetical protein
MESGIRLLTSTDLNTVTTSKTETYGAVGLVPDGRRFRYAGFGGTATINAGLLVVAAAKTANSNALAVTAVGTGGQVTANLALGSKTLVVTNGATAVTQDQFADGYLEVLWSGGVFAVRIDGNTAAANAGYITLQLAPGGLQNTTALVAGTDTVNLTASPYAAVVPSLTQSAPVGVTIVQAPNTASVTNYGWVQTNGHAIVSATSAVKGQGITQDQAGTAGYLKTTSAATDASVGIAKESSANSAASVELDLPS